MVRLTANMGSKRMEYRGAESKDIENVEDQYGDNKSKSLDTGWRFDGSIWTFVDVVKCAMVFWKMSHDNIVPLEERSKIMTNPDLINAKAEEYGMKEYSISKEMVRNGKDIIDLLIGTQIAINEGKIEVR